MSLRPHIFSASRSALVGGVLAAALMAGLVSAQSLGEVARKEEARRKTVAVSTKVYTNDTLKFDHTVPTDPSKPAAGGSAPASAGTSAATPASGAATSPAASGNEAKGDEATWKKKKQAIVDGIERSQTFADALQSRINGLTGDFAARDDPAQRAKLGADRQKALGELERVKKEIQQQTKALADLQEEARKAGVPAGWLR